MERITICGGTVADSGCSAICLRLEDGPQVFYHSTGIRATGHNDGLLLSLNPETRRELDRHGLAMCKAYTLMQLRGLTMDNRIFETEVLRMLTCEGVPLCTKTEATETLYPRFVRYLEDAHRDGVIGDARYAVAIGKARKLNRFLTIMGLSSITADDFTPDLVLQFRQLFSTNTKMCRSTPNFIRETQDNGLPPSVAATLRWCTTSSCCRLFSPSSKTRARFVTRPSEKYR